MKFTNPIIPGFAPDPSIVLVKDTYYLVNSSFHIFPGLPIYVSKDLLKWDLLNHAISRPKRLSLDHAWMKHIPVPHTPNLIITGGLFAPTIRYHNSTFYIVCTNAIEHPVSKDHTFQNFLISCPEDQIQTPDAWSDPLYFDFPGIDPSLFFDDATGRAYVQGSYREGPPWAPDCSIRQFEIDVKTGKPLSEIRELWKGANAKHDAEGPHLLKKDGWYYLITAEGSTFEGHEINIARARDIWGPYEAYDSNPLLTAYETNEEVQWTGHGDLFIDTYGRWWCVHLGVRNSTGDEMRCPLGRETFLTPVAWDEGSWPKISQTKLEFEAPSVPMGQAGDQDGAHATDFGRKEDVYIRSPDLTKYKIEGPNTYALSPQASGMSSAYGTTSFIGRRQRSLTCSAVVRLKLCQRSSSNLQAGLAVYKDSLRHAEIFWHASKNLIEFRAVSTAEVHSTEIRSPPRVVPNGAEAVVLRIDAQSEKYDFSWSAISDGVELCQWHHAGSIGSAALSGHDMTGTIFGVFAHHAGPEALSGYWVRFEDFGVKY